MLKKVLTFLILFFLVFLISVSFIYLKDNYSSLNTENKFIEVYIDKGESLNSISKKLYESKIISSKLLFKLYGKVNNSYSNLKYGPHDVSASMSYSEIYDSISKSTLDTKKSVKVTIPEGYTVKQIASLLDSKSLVNGEEFLSLCKIGNFDYPFLNDIPTDFLEEDSYRLEGFLFPETYFIDKNSSCKDIIIIMLDKFNELYSQLENNNKYSFYDTLKIASIIEREAGSGNERPIIASVFYNRLNKSIKLESCATVEYVLNTRKRVLSEKDISIDSHFNTYKFLGLPPTPIANPGEESIQAALSPSDTEYLFFVSINGTNKHAFAKSYSEHKENVVKYRDFKK